MKEYRIESTDGCKSTVLSDGKVAHQLFTGNPKFYSKLSDTDNDFMVFEWNHGMGKGKVRIPMHIVFDLPELLTILNHARTDGSLCSEQRIYASQPVATLFPRSK